MNNKLPQIIIPENKVDMFIEWYDADIRFTDSCPHAFDEGYLLLDTSEKDLSAFKNHIKEVAHTTGKTYREVENDMMKSFEQPIIIYFKFLPDDRLFIERYSDKECKIKRAKGTCTFGPGESPPIAPLFDEIMKFRFDVDDEMLDKLNDGLNHVCVSILVTALWYIATAKSNRYIYSKDIPIVSGRHKNKKIIDVKDTRVVSVPIFDMNKITVLKTDKLIKRRQGWTYSHAFQVHGHYRHYRDGKVVFIKSFIKGKDKELKAQKTILEPEG